MKRPERNCSILSSGTALPLPRTWDSRTITQPLYHLGGFGRTRVGRGRIQKSSAATSRCGGRRRRRNGLIHWQRTWSSHLVSHRLTLSCRVVDIGCPWLQMPQGAERLATHEQAQQRNNEVTITHFRLRRLLSGALRARDYADSDEYIGRPGGSPCIFSR